MAFPDYSTWVQSQGGLQGMNLSERQQAYRQAKASYVEPQAAPTHSDLQGMNLQERNQIIEQYEAAPPPVNALPPPPPPEAPPLVALTLNNVRHNELLALTPEQVQAEIQRIDQGLESTMDRNTRLNDGTANGTYTYLEQLGLTPEDAKFLEQNNPEVFGAFDSRDYLTYLSGNSLDERNAFIASGGEVPGLNLTSGDFGKEVYSDWQTRYNETGTIKNPDNNIAGTLGIGGTAGEFLNDAESSIKDNTEELATAVMLYGLGGAGAEIASAPSAGVQGGSTTATGVVNPTGSGAAGTGPGVATAGGSNPLSTSAAVTTASGIPDGITAPTNVLNGSTTPSAISTPNTTDTGDIGSGMDLSDWLNLAGTGASSYLSNEATQDIIGENKRQFDLTRSDYEPYRNAGVNALSSYEGAMGNYNRDIPNLNVSQGANLPQYQSTGQQVGYNNNSSLPQYQSAGQQLGYSNNVGLPQYQSAGQQIGYQNADTQGLPDYNPAENFQFNLAEDQGYIFARDQAQKAVERSMAARGMNNSGNVMNEVADRITGVASQYTNDAYNRQLGAYNTNYNKDVTDYNIGKNASDTRYQRGVNDYGINSATNTENYNRNLTDFNAQKSLTDTQYQRGVTDYGINSATNTENFNRNLADLNARLNLSDTQYNRGVTDYGINSGINTENYNRNVADYGIGTDYANSMYGRDMDAYNVSRSREGELYNRDQNYLNQLGGLVDVGRGATNSLANAGQYYTGANNQATWNNVNSFNNSIQGGIENYLTQDYINQRYG